jgi:hypothetical protein
MFSPTFNALTTKASVFSAPDLLVLIAFLNRKIAYRVQLGVLVWKWETAGAF